MCALLMFAVCLLAVPLSPYMLRGLVKGKACEEQSVCHQVLQEGRFKAPEELAEVFKGAGIDLERPIVTSCGTGVTASVLALALHQISPASEVRTHGDQPSHLLMGPCLQDDILLALNALSIAFDMHCRACFLHKSMRDSCGTLDMAHACR